jgi:Beta-1,3-glucanase
MIRLFALIGWFPLFLLHADPTTFSRERVDKFYDKYITEAKQIASEAGVTRPPCTSGLLPVVLINNSGLADDLVFVLVLGKEIGSATQFFVSIDTTNCPGKGTAHPVMPSDNATDFTLALSQLPPADTLLTCPGPGRVLYLPAIAGGRIYLSTNTKLNMPIVSGKIAEPNFTSPNDPNYTVNFDKFELTYDNTKSSVAPALFTNSTAVDFFSVPLQGIVFNPGTGGKKTFASGLSQSRSTILSGVSTTFSVAPAATEWNKLILKDPGDPSKTLRIVNPTKSIAQGTAEGQTPFDLNYFDNAAAYSGYSYIEDIWSDVSSFYKSGNTLFIKMPPGTGTGQTYGADFTSIANKIEFTSTTDPSRRVILLAPTASATLPTTTSNIFGGLILFDPNDPLNAANPADAQQISQLFEDAIISSVIPKSIPSNLPLTTNDTANPNSVNDMASNAAHANFYMVNPNLSALGQTLGPWFSLYSKAFHDFGLIYTYAFDEGIWPQVLISTSTQNNTYLQVTIGNVS